MTTGLPCNDLDKGPPTDFPAQGFAFEAQGFFLLAQGFAFDAQGFFLPAQGLAIALLSNAAERTLRAAWGWVATVAAPVLKTAIAAKVAK